jgi:hypothetical protein
LRDHEFNAGSWRESYRFLAGYRLGEIFGNDRSDTPPLTMAPPRRFNGTQDIASGKVRGVGATAVLIDDRTAACLIDYEPA